MKTARKVFTVSLLAICLTIGATPVFFYWLPDGDGIYLTADLPIFIIFVNLLIRLIVPLFGVWICAEVVYAAWQARQTSREA